MGLDCPVVFYHLGSTSSADRPPWTLLVNLVGMGTWGQPRVPLSDGSWRSHSSGVAFGALLG